MTGNRKFLAYALSTAFGLVAAVGSANAACTALAGTWYLQGITVNSPTQTVTKANSITCTVTINAGGGFTNVPCTSYSSFGGAGKSTHATGNLTISACNITGTISVTGESPVVTVRAGHINGVMGTFITTQGKDIGHFTLIKN